MTRRFVQMHGSESAIVLDTVKNVTVRTFVEWLDGPDFVALARAEADRLEAEHSPPPEWRAKAQWVNGPGDRRIRCEQDGAHNYALAARVAELLNRHGLTDGES